MNDKDNITIGRPKEGGALFFAPAGTTLPTSADAELDEAFVNLGFVTEDGITFNTSEEGDDIKAWGPVDVIHSQTGYTKTATFNLLETAKVAVLQFLYGKNNVTVKEDGSIKWRDTGDQLPAGVFVCDTLQANSGAPRIKRQVFGDAQFTDRSGDHTYNNSDPVSFPIVLTARKFADTDGAMVYDIDYLSAPISSTEEDETAGKS